MSVATLLRIIMFDCKSGLLKSRQRYFNRKSSFVLIFSSIGNGGVSDSDNTRICSATTSISPVFKFSLTAPERFCTFPTTAITYSLRIPYAFLKPSLPTVFSSNKICKIPLLSLKSTKMSAPRFLLVCTQPITVTVSPIFAAETSVHLCVLFKPTIDSAML